MSWPSLPDSGRAALVEAITTGTTTITCPFAEMSHTADDVAREKVEHVDGVGYRIKFRCVVCRCEFTVSETTIRRALKRQRTVVRGEQGA